MNLFGFVIDSYILSFYVLVYILCIFYLVLVLYVENVYSIIKCFIDIRDFIVLMVFKINLNVIFLILFVIVDFYFVFVKFNVV